MNQLLDYYFGSRNLRLTSPNLRGRDVRILQALLNRLPGDIIREKLMVDGIFGPLTRNAVRDFQKYFGLVVDGIVGPESYLRLGHRIGKYAQGEAVFSSRILQNGARGGDVRVLQDRLAAFPKNYLNQPADGRYMFFTQEAVRRFQQDFPNLVVDSIVGPDTYEQIFIRAPLGGRNLRIASNGLDTYFLQYFLFQLGYYQQQPNGYFDKITETAVKAFQSDADISVDGIVGPQTYLALGTSIPFPQKEYYYRVRRGDSVFLISELFNKKMEDIIQLNRLQPPDYIIFTGQLLRIPVPLNFHLAQKGDTFADVAFQYSLSLEKIQAANDLQPDGYLLPDEAIVLPAYSQPLSGESIFLQHNEAIDELKKINLSSGQITTLQLFDDLSSQQLFLSKDRKSLALFANNGRQIKIYDLATSALRTLNLSEPADYLDWSYDGKKLVVGSGRVINAIDGSNIFTFEGLLPQWLADNKNLLYVSPETSLKKINIETGVEELVLEVPDTSIWFFQLANPVNKVVFLAFVPPGRVTFTYLYDLATDELLEISSNDFLAEWSRTYAAFLLKKRDYYGEFFPWFYFNVSSYLNSGPLIGSEIYAKVAELNNDNFAPADQAFLLVMHNPDTFYPIPLISRDLFAKQFKTRLLTQLTSGQMIFNPLWL